MPLNSHAYIHHTPCRPMLKAMPMCYSYAMCAVQLKAAIKATKCDLGLFLVHFCLFHALLEIILCCCCVIVMLPAMLLCAFDSIQVPFVPLYLHSFRR